MSDGIVPITLGPLGPADAHAVLELARGLPEWFTANGLREMETDLKFQVGLVAEQAGERVGFGTLYVAEGIGHIGWLGVRQDLHRRGIGERLVEGLAALLRDAGVREMRVSTLGDSVEYEPYARTRAFYRAVGFADFERRTLDNPECPEQLILARDIRN